MGPDFHDLFPVEQREALEKRTKDVVRQVREAVKRCRQTRQRRNHFWGGRQEDRT